jgi:hypothetical protein
MARIGAAALVGWLAPGVARADHEAAMADHHHEPGMSIGVAVEAAQFSNTLYIGSYQGVLPQITWMDDRLGANATIGFYHLVKNGLSVYGMGDAMFGGHAALIASDAAQAGVALHLMLPTGSELEGLGMGHVMAMPSAWASWRSQPWTLRASAGYARAVNPPAGAHDHGPSPLVEPMNMEELTWSAGADVDLTDRTRIGGRAQGGIPIGTGRERVIGAGRVAWGTPRLSTAFELQLGVVGDPFGIRGVVETALRF